MATPKPITFTFGYADYKVLNRLMRRDSAWKRSWFIIVPVMTAILLSAVIVGISLINGRSVSRGLGTLVSTWQFWSFVAVSVPFVWGINQLELKLYYKRQRIDGTVVSVSVDDVMGITSETSSGTGVIPWSGVRKIVSDADAHVVLYENRAIGLCLPRRAFETQKDFDDLAAYVSTRIPAKPSA